MWEAMGKGRGRGASPYRDTDISAVVGASLRDRPKIVSLCAIQGVCFDIGYLQYQ